MKKIVVSGKTVENAVKLGLAELNTTEDRVKVTVLQHGSKGLFGLIGSKEAKVELEVIPDTLEQTILFLNEVFLAMNLVVQVDKIVTEEGITFNLVGSDLGILIGRRGQTLDSLQYLVNIVANRFSNHHLRIVLDAEQFRERRRQTLEALAERMAVRVIRTRKEIVLEPMTAQERKIIHAKLQGNPSVKTYSQGDEPNRRIVIAIK